MTKKGGKSSRQINSHECPSELCLCFSPAKNSFSPVQESGQSWGEGQSWEKQPRHCHLSRQRDSHHGGSKSHLCFPSSAMEGLGDIPAAMGERKTLLDFP